MQDSFRSAMAAQWSWFQNHFGQRLPQRPRTKDNKDQTKNRDGGSCKIMQASNTIDSTTEFLIEFFKRAEQMKLKVFGKKI